MILKCTQCGEKMRVHDESVPPGKKVKVRCPHCQAVGVAWLPGPEADPAAQPASAALVEESQHTQPAAESAVVTAEKEPPIPADAFNSFRFPSEDEGAEPQSKPMSRKLRLLLWIAASAGVILFFALLVNLVLPGPPR
jgi:predicted Zn finger-like uncharacterized protein